MRKESRFILVTLNSRPVFLSIHLKRNRGEWHFVEFLVLATCRTFRLLTLSCPPSTPLVTPTKTSIKVKMNHRLRTRRADCSAICLHSVMVILRVRMVKWQRVRAGLLKAVTHEAQAVVGSDALCCGLPAHSCSAARRQPAVTGTVFLLGCYSPV